ncbi:hypothetical protein MMC17_008751 [Xylographa soralifera]|nr:hypothetical protein [Xylographa soralifera]
MTTPDPAFGQTSKNLGTHSRDKSIPFPRTSSEIFSVGESSTAKKSSENDYTHDQTGSGTTPTAVDLAALEWAQTNAEEGDYFLIYNYGKEPRPGVICDEEMVITFSRLVRPSSAKQPDGSYHEQFLPYGKYARQKSYPFMYLDSLRIVYAPWNLLIPIDFAMIAKKQDDPKIKPSLKRAFTDLFFGYDLGYWKSELLVKLLNKENRVEKSNSMNGVKEGGSPKMNHPQKRKRVDFEAQGSRGLPTLRALEVGDEEDDDESQYFKTEPESGAAQDTFGSGIIGQDHGSLYDVSDTESRPDGIKTKKIRQS